MPTLHVIYRLARFPESLLYRVLCTHIALCTLLVLCSLKTNTPIVYMTNDLLPSPDSPTSLALDFECDRICALCTITITITITCSSLLNLVIGGETVLMRCE